MIFCYRCGIELDTEAAACPLCLTPTPQEAASPPRLTDTTGFPDEAYDVDPSAKQVPMGRMRRGVVTLALLSPILPLMLTWYLQGSAQDWMWWCAAALFYLWVLLVPAKPLHRKPIPLSAVAAATAAALLFAIDASRPPLDWAAITALPIAAIAATALAVVHRSSRGFTRWDLPAAAYTSLAFAAATTGIDGVINRYFGDPFIGPWIALFIAAVPIASLSFYLHYREGVRVDFSKVFHI